MNGIIIINKPIKNTSHDIVYKIKKIVKEKVGHTGTLDPMAEGVLPILVGEATKCSKYLINHDKTYIVELELGKRTDTLDSEGKILEEKQVDSNILEKENVESVLNTFLGEQKQIPPMYSAIKVKGKKLYEYARKGENVEIAPRNITIYDIQLLDVDIKEKKILFEVSCSKGTYIRSLCEDIAKKLGTIGYMTKLKRTKVGDFKIEDSVSIEEFEKNPTKYIIPLEEIFKENESISLTDKKLELFLNGVKLSNENEDGVYTVNPIPGDQDFTGTEIDPSKPVEEVTVGVVIDKDVLEKSTSEELQNVIDETIKSGNNVKTEVEISNIEVENASEEVQKDIALIDKEVENKKLTVAQYLDLSISVKSDDTLLGNITETTQPLTFKVAIPENLKKEGRIFIAQPPLKTISCRSSKNKNEYHRLFILDNDYHDYYLKEFTKYKFDLMSDATDKPLSKALFDLYISGLLEYGPLMTNRSKQILMDPNILEFTILYFHEIMKGNFEKFNLVGVDVKITESNNDYTDFDFDFKTNHYFMRVDKTWIETIYNPLIRILANKVKLNSVHFKNKNDKKIYKGTHYQYFKLIESFFSDGSNVKRFKGLGEMGPDLIFESVLNPETRRIMQVTLNDAEDAEETINLFLNKNKIEDRKNYFKDLQSSN